MQPANTCHHHVCSSAFAALALAAQQAAKEGHEGATPESGPWSVAVALRGMAA